MVEFIVREKKDDILIKDCQDFVPLNDGTVSGDKRYCDLSLLCRQSGMTGHYVEIRDVVGNTIEHDYFCTGKRIKREEILNDEEAS